MSLASAVARASALTALAARLHSPPALRPPTGAFEHALAQASHLPSRASGHRETPYRGLVLAAADRYGVDPALIQAVMETESGGDPQAQSPAGAVGLMQLMPSTAEALGVSDPYDPAQSIDAGTRYLASQLRRFGDAATAVAAYNAGPGAVQRWGGIPPYQETREYVASVLERYAELKAERSGGGAP